MTQTPIDPAATPEDEDAATIAADDAGASALAERIGRQAENPILPEGPEADDDD